MSEVEHVLPPSYGILIAFITGVLGYVLWVSFSSSARHYYSSSFVIRGRCFSVAGE